MYAKNFYGGNGIVGAQVLFTYIGNTSILNISQVITDQ